MKTLKIFSISILFLSFFNNSFAQETKTESFKVSGNCGMCKSTIEKAARAAGAEYADWNKETKELSITYSTTSTNTAKVQKAIAAAGYDNPGFRAENAAYEKLPKCCHYERDATVTAKCCDSDQCGKENGKCTEMGCCKDGKCSSMKENAKMDCCKNGKCEKHSK